MKSQFMLAALLLGAGIKIQAKAVAAETVAPASLSSSGTRAAMNLNGSWQILPIQGIKFTYPPPAEGWKAEKVPSEQSTAMVAVNGPYPPPPKELLNAEGTDFKRKDGMAAWYRRDFAMPATPLTEKRAMLHFGGMAFRNETWVNGTKVGESVSGLLPIDYDITSLLRTGQTNQIVIGLASREALIDIAAKSYIAPNSGAMPGIYGNVELRLLSEVNVDDIFVKTFVGAKRIEVDVMVSNAGKTAGTVRPQVSILDAKGIPQVSFQGQPLTLPPGQKKTVTFKKEWLAPNLWSPETPTLYSANVDLQSAGLVVDSATQRFGFREFEIRGRDFYLNGQRTVLLRNSFLTSLAATPESARKVVRDNVGRPFNTARLHLGFNNEVLIDAADEMGLMIHPELAWYHTDEFPVAKSEVWLPNTLDYVRQLVKLHRNHPSVTIWNLTNETYWGNSEPDMMKVAEQVLETVKSLDPTRPQEGDGESNWGGRLPIINIHYPEGSGPLRTKYPNSGYLEPNDLYWLSDTEPNKSWPNNTFLWDRPLVIGEYWDPAGFSLEERTSFTGESGYDFEKWRQQDTGGLDRQQSDYIDYLKRATDVYRMRGVAGINPWAGDREDIMPPVAVRSLDFHPNFFSGRSGTRKIVVFNDSGVGYAAMNLQCRLTIDGTTVWEKEIPSNIEPGKSQTFDIPIQCPTVNQSTKAVFTARLRHERGGRWTQLSRHEETIYILPLEKASAEDGAGIVLLDTVGATVKALGQLGVPIAAKTTLTAEDLAKATTLVVGARTDAGPFRNLIGAFIKRGGKAILLSQNYGVPLLPEMAQTDDTHVATRSWVRSASHPILAGVKEAQLSYWQPDNIVSTLTLQKPAVGKSKAIIDSGGRFGLNWVPLLETPIGDGVVLQSQLNIVDRIEQEPLAGHLLLSMLRYCQSYKSQPLQPLRVLAGKNDALMQTLAACAIATAPGLEGQGPVLLDSTYAPSADEVQKLKSFLSAGGKVWLHGFSSANIAAVAGLFPFKPELAAFDDRVQSAARRSDDPLLANISSQEFYWTRVNQGVTGDFFNRAQPTAKLGGEVLVLPNQAAGVKLIEPGLLVKVPTGQGTILFDNLLWENALGSETDKVSRLVTSLALNLGADVQLLAEKNYAYVQADLSQQANMAFYDEIAGDGKGGWTDQGINDMRYFLINHTGVIGNMAVADSEFPTSATFAGRPFRLIDPKKNGGRSVITLRGQEHGPAMPSQVTGIPFGQKADKLWFLHTACWAISNTQHQEVGSYIIHYTDGTQSVFPLRYGLELSDWWDPKPLPNAKMAWSGKNGMHSPVGIYVSEWTNPEPEKTIQSIDVTGNKSETQIVLMGISGGTEVNAATAYKPIVDWDLGKMADGSIASRVGPGNLVSTPRPPEAAEVGGVASQRFAHGQYLMADARKIPGFGAGGPLSLQVVLTPEAKPDGYMGGIYQHMDYLKSGFRLTLNQQMQLNVEAFPADGKPRYFTSKTSLNPGQEYKIELKFDGQRAYIFIDGKLDASLDTPPPAPFAGDISVGQAGGKDYNYNGLIRRITVAVPAG